MSPLFPLPKPSVFLFCLSLHAKQPNVLAILSSTPAIVAVRLSHTDSKETGTVIRLEQVPCRRLELPGKMLGGRRYRLRTSIRFARTYYTTVGENGRLGNTACNPLWRFPSDMDRCFKKKKKKSYDQCTFGVCVCSGRRGC